MLLLFPDISCYCRQLNKLVKFPERSVQFIEQYEVTLTHLQSETALKRLVIINQETWKAGQYSGSRSCYFW